MGTEFNSLQGRKKDTTLKSHEVQIIALITAACTAHRPALSA